MWYRIESNAGADHGVWSGQTATEALCRMHQSAGYDVSVLIDLGGRETLLFASTEDAEICGDVDAWTIEEESSDE